MGGHLGETAGVAAFLGAQLIPGVDVAVDSAEAAEAAEAFEGADEGAVSAKGKSGTRFFRNKGTEENPYTKRVSRLPKTEATLSSQGKFFAGTSAVNDAIHGTLGNADPPPNNQPPPNNPPPQGPAPNLVGEFSSASGNPYLN
jgi:hypothetical protein